jgi:hypothetical protein
MMGFAALNPSYEAVKGTSALPAGMIPCRQGILQGMLYGRPDHQAIRMPHYVTVATA